MQIGSGDDCVLAKYSGLVFSATRYNLS